jgi:hypoxanthine phosphoribosyltransferase
MRAAARRIRRGRWLPEVICSVMSGGMAITTILWYL